MAEYIPIFLDWIDATQELNAQEKGRLIDALVLYARGEDWQDLIRGNERYVFPSFRGQIDRHLGRLEKLRENGRNGGRPKTKANQTEPKLTNENQDKPLVNLGFDEKPKQTKANQTKANNNNNNNDSNNDSDNDSNNGVTVRAHPVRFTPPTIGELKAYCTEQGYKIDTDRFLAYYESNGWRVGRNPMKDWKAAVRTWVRNDATGSQPSKSTPTAMQFEQRDYTGVDFSNLNADLSKYK